jgi:hypothetical protein
MAELVVSAGTIAQLKRVADERGTTAEELAEQAIRQVLIRQVLPESEEVYTIWSPRIVNG